MNEEKINQPPVTTAMIPERSYPSLGSLVSGILIVVLFLAFVSGGTIRFYASFLFLFYSLTTTMWVSVVMLGIFQTFIMLPIRIVNLFKGSHTAAFKEKIEEAEKREQQHFLVKRHARKGTPIFLWYVLTFFFALISYVSMGRLFLTDFYSKPLNPDLLYSWVPYPEYPIEGVMFKIPYVAITETTNYGWRVVLIVWGILIGIRVLIALIKYIRKQLHRSTQKPAVDSAPQQAINKVVNFWNGSFILILIAVWFLIRYFPIGFELRIFTGSVAEPNRTLNFITAVATAFTIIWLDLSKIRKRGVLAAEQGIPEKVIRETSGDQMKNSVRNGTVVGLGAFFITNHIPSAFELSIFTLEIISWVAPFTVDKIILTASRRNGENGSTTAEETSNEEEQ